jgi:predicted HTH domain antitoxin
MYTLSEISAMPISAFQVQLNTKEKKLYCYYHAMDSFRQDLILFIT